MLNCSADATPFSRASVWDLRDEKSNREDEEDRDRKTSRSEGERRDSSGTGGGWRDRESDGGKRGSDGGVCLESDSHILFCSRNLCQC